MEFRNQKLNMEYILKQTKPGLVLDHSIEVYNSMPSGKNFLDNDYGLFMEYKHHICGLFLIKKFGDQPKEITDKIMESGKEFTHEKIKKFFDYRGIK